jgi:hypothetical protein
LQALIDAGAPPAVPPRQIIIGGPIASGRTDIALGIGTEFAFKGAMVRYVSIAALLEFAAQTPFGDDNGPVNIDYWPWCRAQVLIIDDIGPMIAAYREAGRANLDQLSEMLQTGLKPIAGLLAQRHTVWVVGDLRAGKDTSMKDGMLNSVATKLRDSAMRGTPWWSNSRTCAASDLPNRPRWSSTKGRRTSATCRGRSDTPDPA